MTSRWTFCVYITQMFVRDYDNGAIIHALRNNINTRRVFLIKHKVHCTTKSSLRDRDQQTRKQIMTKYK